MRYKRSTVPLQRGTHFRNSRGVFEAFREDMMSFPVEVFRVVFLNAKNEMVSYEDTSRGSLSTSVVVPRDAFWSAVHFRSASVIFLHHHPSGDPAPSREDRECTERLVRTAEVLGIRVLDHIVIGSLEYFSFADAGLIQRRGWSPDGVAEPVDHPFNAGGRKMKGNKQQKTESGKKATKKAEVAHLRGKKAAKPNHDETKVEGFQGPAEPNAKVTIKQVVIGMFLGNSEIRNDELIAAVKAKFPESKFSETHAAWYRTQARKGLLTGTPMPIPHVVRGKTPGKA